MEIREELNLVHIENDQPQNKSYQKPPTILSRRIQQLFRVFCSGQLLYEKKEFNIIKFIIKNGGYSLELVDTLLIPKLNRKANKKLYKLKINEESKEIIYTSIKNIRDMRGKVKQ